MERRKFLRTLFAGSIGLAVVPTVLIRKDPEYFIGCDPAHIDRDHHHIVMVRRYPNTSVYLDGKKQDDKFLINEMPIWKRQLTDKEVQALYNYGKSLTEDQILTYWT